MNPVSQIPVVILLLCALALPACDDQGGGEPANVLSPEAIALNNRGVALMGYFDYAGAHAAFTELVRLQPEWSEAQVNLAIATLNRQLEGDEQRALNLVAGVLEKSPDHLRARYVTGLLKLYLGDTGASLEHFRVVAQGDPMDAYAAYYIGQNLLQRGDVEASLGWYLRAIEQDAYLRSAYYGAAQVLRRLDRREEAKAMLRDYQRFKDNPRARLAEFKYTRMGPKAQALAADLPGATQHEPPSGDIFGEPYDLSIPQVEGIPTLTTVDIDGDTRQDLFLAHPAGTLVLTAASRGGYANVEHPLAGRAGVNAALWGDLDNDGLVDAYLCRQGPNELWRQSASGQWEDITEASGTADGERDCADGSLLDADHDGDLDIFVVNRDSHNELFNNNRDGSYTGLASDYGLAGIRDGSARVLAMDLDQDRDVDLITIAARPPHGVHINDRLWQYRQAEGFDTFLAADVRAAVGGDLDADGRADMVSLDGNGRLWWWRADDEGVWAGREVAAREVTGEGQLALLDFSGDGRHEVLWQHTDGFSLYAFGADAPWEERLSVPGEILALQPVLQDPARGPSLVSVMRVGGMHVVRVWPPGPGRYSFAAVRLTGKEENADSMRSNASGIGTQVALRNGSTWTVTDTFDKSSAPGQSLQPLALGLAGEASADYLAINWSDGVFQTELGPESGLQTIAETQRQLSSCPVLFAWNGSRFDFVSDLLGVGGLGAFVSPGRYAQPRPWEFFALPEGLLQARNGQYQLKLGEPMEENAYLDMARLHVYDIPQDWFMGVDERLAVNGPPASGRPFFYRSEVLAVRATNDRGEDVTDTLRRRDSRAAPVGELDHRFIGRLAVPHRLELEFAAPLPAAGEELVLLADGWVEYPYSQTSFAAWQAGATYSAPTLEARDGRGRWHTVYEQFGYPAGMPREMAMPLPALPQGTDALRLTTEREVYWDRIRVVVSEVPAGKGVTTLDVSRARLNKNGFPKRSTGAQRVPDYDYEDRSAYWDTKYLTGAYTRLGSMTPLITARDDALAVFGPGEEIHMEFPALTRGPAEGRKRVFVLELWGYAKDMDLYTEHGETVGPLPVTLSADDPDLSAQRDALHRRYNIRFLAGK